MSNITIMEGASTIYLKSGRVRHYVIAEGQSPFTSTSAV